MTPFAIPWTPRLDSMQSLKMFALWAGCLSSRAATIAGVPRGGHQFDSGLISFPTVLLGTCSSPAIFHHRWNYMATITNQLFISIAVLPSDFP